MKYDKEKMFKIFFGNPNFPKGIIIITPISKIYKQIGSKYLLMEKTKGWWQRVKIKINSTPVTLLKIPPGPHIKDCLKTFNPKEVKKVILLGFCGALNQNLKIGEIVVPKTVLFRNAEIVSPIRLKKEYKLMTVSQIILDSPVFRKLLKNKIDFLDMETYFLYRWGKQYNIPTISILIVTDKPNSLPFFLCGKNELETVDGSISKLINKLSQYLGQNQI